MVFRFKEVVQIAAKFVPLSTMNCKQFFGFIIGCLVLMGCGKNKDATTPATPPDLVMQVKQCARLHTAEYRIHKLVTFDDIVRMKGSFLSDPFDIKLPLGDRKIVIPLDVTLRAYIDFSHFTEQQIERTGNRIILTLPDPQVIVSSSKIDHRSVRQYVDFTRADFTDEEMARFARQGEEAIINRIASYGILEKARSSAAHTLIPLLARMGYTEDQVTVRFRKDFTPDELKRFVERPSNPS